MTSEDVLKELKASMAKFQSSEDWSHMEMIYNDMKGWKDAFEWIKDEILKLEEK